MAVGRNKIDAVRLLVESGADINIKDNRGLTIKKYVKKYRIFMQEIDEIIKNR